MSVRCRWWICYSFNVMRNIRYAQSPLPCHDTRNKSWISGYGSKSAKELQVKAGMLDKDMKKR